MNLILSILILTLALELMTIFFRLVFHLKSAVVQQSIAMPRIHHAYVGVAILLVYFWSLPRESFLILGLGLILSDLVHHLITIPLVRKMQIDVGLHYHESAHNFLQVISGIIMTLPIFFFNEKALAGSIALLILGIMLIVGRESTDTFLKFTFGSRIFRTYIKKHLDVLKFFI